MDFASIEDATNWAYLEGLYQGAQVEVAKAHGAQGEALDGWTKNGLYIGAVVEVWRHVLPVDGEAWQCAQALRVLFPGECRYAQADTLGGGRKGGRVHPRGP